MEALPGRGQGWAWRVLLAAAAVTVLVTQTRGAALPTWQVEHELFCDGPIDDAKCDVDAVEQANDQQLHRSRPPDKHGRPPCRPSDSRSDAA